MPILALGNVIAETEEEKVAILIISFFLIPLEPELETSYNSKKKVIELTGRVLRELPPFILDKIRTAIFRYNPKKVLGSDEIIFKI